MNRFVVFVRFVLRCEFAADSGFARGQFVDQRCIAWPLVISKSFKQCPKEKFRICDALVIPLVAQIDHIIEPNDDLSNLWSKPSECRHLSGAHAHADTKHEVSAANSCIACRRMTPLPAANTGEFAAIMVLAKRSTSSGSGVATAVGMDL